MSLIPSAGRQKSTSEAPFLPSFRPLPTDRPKGWSNSSHAAREDISRWWMMNHIFMTRSLDGRVPVVPQLNSASCKRPRRPSPHHLHSRSLAAHKIDNLPIPNLFIRAQQTRKADAHSHFIICGGTRSGPNIPAAAIGEGRFAWLMNSLDSLV